MFYIYDDVPLYWDAWDIMDYHLETRDLPDFSEIGAVERFADGPIVGGYKWTATFGKSTIERYTILRAESPMLEYYTIVNWNEDHKLLKVEFPVDILAREATFEIQYGHAKRPTHINTSWEMAKFEVCGHKWMDISQADKGVSFITDSKYGWHVRGNHVQLSLLKSPKNPDDHCDIHKHYMYYAVLPHTGSFQESGVVQKAYELNVLGCNNVPLLNKTPTTLPIDFVTTNNPAVIVETVKVSKPENDVTNTLCIRLYEAYGGYAKNTEISIPSVSVTGVFNSNGLERKFDAIPFSQGTFTVDFKPFQIQSFLVTFN